MIEYDLRTATIKNTDEVLYEILVENGAITYKVLWRILG